MRRHRGRGEEEEEEEEKKKKKKKAELFSPWAARVARRDGAPLSSSGTPGRVAHPCRRVRGGGRESGDGIGAIVLGYAGRLC